MADRTLEILMIAQGNLPGVIDKVADNLDKADDKTKDLNTSFSKATKKGFEFGRALEVAVGGALVKLADIGAGAALDFLGKGFAANAKAGGEEYTKLIEKVNEAVSKLAAILTRPIFDLFVAGLNTFIALMPQIEAGLQGFMDGLMALPNSPFGQWIQNELIPALQAAGASINESLQPALVALQPLLDQIGAIVGPILAEGMRLLGQYITQYLIPSFATWAKMTLDAIPLMIELGKVIGGEINAAVATLGSWWKILSDNVAGAVQWLTDAYDALVSLAELLQGNIAQAFQWFIDNVIAPFTKALAALKGYIGQVISAFEKLAGIGGALPSVPSAGGTSPTVAGPGFARGGSFIVPQGFPNDSFPMRVSSGERVTVTPRGASGGGQFVFNVSVSNDAMLNALMRKVRGLAMMNAT